MKGSLSSGLLELKGLLNKQQLFFLQVQLFTSSPLIALPVGAGIAPVGVFVSHTAHQPCIREEIITWDAQRVKASSFDQE